MANPIKAIKALKKVAAKKSASKANKRGLKAAKKPVSKNNKKVYSLDKKIKKMGILKPSDTHPYKSNRTRGGNLRGK